MSVINIKNLTFAYDSSVDFIFKNTSFSIDSDWKLGFVGRNGRGKTTLFKLFMGKLDYEGVIQSSLQFDYFPFDVENKQRNTMDIVFEIAPLCEEWAIYRELNLLFVDADCLFRPFDSLSLGEQSKILLASLFLKNNNFLLIDEPTNHLDLMGRKILKNFLDRKKGFIVISHDRDFLDGCVNHILAINKANITVQKGNFSSWFAEKERQDLSEIEKNQRIIGEIDRLKKASKKRKNWADIVEAEKFGSDVPDRGYIGHKSAKMMKSAKVIERRQNLKIAEKTELLKNVEKYDDLKISPLKHFSSLLVEAKDLKISFKDRVLFEGLSFSIYAGDRVSITGANGAGKSSIIKAICGDDVPFEGCIKKASGLVISVIFQNCEMEGSLVDFANRSEIDVTKFFTILAKLDFKQSEFEKNLKDLSSGQKKKVQLAKSLSQNAHLYVWDEPLNFLDVFSRIQIERLILDFNFTILLVEHDSAFVSRVINKTIAI